MSKVIFGFAVLLFLLTFSKVTFADCTLPNCTVSSTPAANEIYQNTPSITIEVNNEGNNFNPDVGYTFNAWNVSDLENRKGCLPVSQYSKNSNPNQPAQLTVTSSKITAFWKPTGDCGKSIGQWKFQLWSGQGTKDRSESSIIANYDFAIQQDGGGVPALTPLQQVFQLGTKPTVLVSNARAGQSYTFWWEDSRHDWAASKKNLSDSDPDFKNGILFVKLDLNGVDFRAGVTRKLCMENGDYTSATGILGVTCRYSTTFVPSNNPPPANGVQCAVLPSLTPTITDDVKLKITNAVPDTTYGGSLDKDGENISEIAPLPVDNEGILILPVGQKLAKGNYVPHIKDTSTNEALGSCDIGFTVGEITQSTIITDICKESPEKCTSAGGQQAAGCGDSKSPAISTAIGCIHTNPSELVKDALTFAIGIGGGLSFLLMLVGAFQMLTSAGNPETLNAGRDRLTNAVIGLLFIIFAVLLLKIIGVDILNIPGLGR